MLVAKRRWLLSDATAILWRWNINLGWDHVERWKVLRINLNNRVSNLNIPHFRQYSSIVHIPSWKFLYSFFFFPNTLKLTIKEYFCPFSPHFILFDCFDWWIGFNPTIRRCSQVDFSRMAVSKDMKSIVYRRIII